MFWLCMQKSSFQFVHPGTFMSPSMTFSLRENVQANPIRRKALEALLKSTHLSYKPQALQTVHIDFGGKGQGHAECTKDGEMAVSAALLFWATGNADYARLSLSILKAWAHTNTTFGGDNAPLEAAWSVCSMARAAELLKHSKNTEIRSLWENMEPSFFSWLDGVISPLLKSLPVWRWQWNNWHTSMLCARMQIAILREDHREWQWSLETCKEIMKRCICNTHCQGEIIETQRDITHAQFLLGGLIQAPEMALHQGVDVYDPRLIQCTELHAQLLLKEVPMGLERKNIKTPYGYWAEPVFEIAYHHFGFRKNQPMPFTKKLLTTKRPDKVTFHWGGNTLTHAM